MSESKGEENASAVLGGSSEAECEPERSPAISRRSLLAGSAGLTLGSVALSGARAQEGQVEMAQHGGHGAGSLSQRAYPVNMGPAGLVDIAHNPADLPPPIARREPATVRVDLETIEVEARLSDQAGYRFWTSTAACRGRSFASASATLSRCICAIIPAAGCSTISISTPSTGRAAARS